MRQGEAYMSGGEVNGEGGKREPSAGRHMHMHMHAQTHMGAASPPSRDTDTHTPMVAERTCSWAKGAHDQQSLLYSCSAASCAGGPKSPYPRPIRPSSHTPSPPCFGSCPYASPATMPAGARHTCAGMSWGVYRYSRL